MKQDALKGLLWELQRHALFEALAPDELESFLKLARPVVFPARRQLFSQGDESDSLYVVLSGQVKVSISSDIGKETVLAILGQHELLGEMGVLSGQDRSAGATALKETRTLCIARSDIMRLLESNPAIAMRIIASLTDRLRQTNAQLEDMATLPAPQRLARALLRLADDHGKPANGKDEDGSILLDIKLSQSALGALAGLMRENVNRQMKEWRDSGIIEQDGGAIVLQDIERLRLVGAGDEC